jgi:PhnB protein
MATQPSRVRAIPEGYHTMTPHLVVRGAERAIEFYKKAFGAVERGRMAAPGGLIGHAELKIGDSILMLSDEFPQMTRWVAPDSLKGTTTALHLYVEDADAFFARAVAAGAKVSMPLMDAFWGDRYGKLTDPFGHEWSVATHMHDYTPEEVQKNMDAFFAQMPKPPG